MSNLPGMLWVNLRGVFLFFTISLTFLFPFRPRLEKFCVATQDRFLISIIAGVIRDYQPLWEKVYFYTSSS